MRDLVIKRLESILDHLLECGEEGLTCYPLDITITSASELQSLTDEELLDTFEENIGFQG